MAEQEENKEEGTVDEDQNFHQLLNNNNDILKLRNYLNSPEKRQAAVDSFITTNPKTSIVPAKTLSLHQPAGVVDEPDMMEATQEFQIPLDDDDRDKIAAEIAEID